MLKWLSDLLWPLSCLDCHALGVRLCTTCASRIPLRGSPDCMGCGKSSRTGVPCPRCAATLHVDRLIAATSMATPLVQRAVWHLKYRNSPDLAAHLGALLVRAAGHASLALERPLVVPVPLHPKRLGERGYNQAELLARELSNAAAWPLAPDALARVRRTDSQVKTHSRAERRDNMKNAFCVFHPELVGGRDVVLVDDVCTTGATLDACALALKESGANSVTAVVLARG